MKKFYYKSLLLTILIFVSSCAKNIDYYPNNGNSPMAFIPEEYKKEALGFEELELKEYNDKELKELYDNIIDNTITIDMLTKNDLLNLLDLPSLVKTQDSIELWQYRSSSCVLNIVWEQDMHKQNVAYTINKESISSKQCFIILSNEKTSE